MSDLLQLASLASWPELGTEMPASMGGVVSRFEGADTADAFCLSTTCTGSALLRDSTMPRLKVLARNMYGGGIVLSDTKAENVS